ncbi:MAG: cation:proton antiporter [Nanoarchaeota archaeon]
MGQEVLWSLSIILGIAALITVVARMIRQPPIIAYLIAGIIVGPLFLKFLNPISPSTEIIQIFSHMGVAFLLFIVGLSLDFRVLKEIGGVATIAGFSEIFLTGITGGFIAYGLGFSSFTAVYIGTALAFSSTVVVVKILSDKKEIDTLHGRIALGILIVEDFVASIALMVVPLMNEGGGLSVILYKLGSVILLVAAVFLGAMFVFGKFMDYLSRSQEVLFLFGIAWALLLASLFDYLGFSLEIGALIAGMSLASSKYTLELGGKMKPLRDFFVVLFFVFFGSQLAGTISWALAQKALIISGFIILGKPLIIMSILRVFGYKKRTNFLAGSSLAQISEFSLILILLGFSLGHVSQEIMNLVILVAIITIGISSYGMYYAHAIFNRISHFLKIFEGKNPEHLKTNTVPYEIVLIGYHRMGYKMIASLKKLKAPFVIIDHNPKVILSLAKWGMNCIYGDASDKEFLHELQLQKVKLIISTIPDVEPNRAIQEHLKQINSKAIFIATAEQPREAFTLYDQGVDYVLIPHHLGGEYASHIIEKYKINKALYRQLGKRHHEQLNKGKNNSEYL